MPEVLTLPMALDMDRHARWLQVLASAEAAGELGKTGIPVVPFRAHETLASSKVAGWASPAHITFAGDRRDWGWRGMSAHPESAFCALVRGRPSLLLGAIFALDHATPNRQRRQDRIDQINCHGR